MNNRMTKQKEKKEAQLGEIKKVISRAGPGSLGGRPALE
jgi:hypothetical protein